MRFHLPMIIRRLPGGLRRATVVCALVSCAAASGSARASAPKTDAAEELLRRTVAAYRQVPAMRDTVRATVTSGDTVSQTETRYSLGAGSDTDLSVGGVRVISLDGRVSILRDDVGDKYLETSLEGTLQETLARLFGDAAPAPIAVLSMRHATDEARAIEDALAHLGTNLVGRLTVSGSETIVSGRGRDLHRLHLEAPEGQVELDIRPDTFFLTSIRIRRPASDTSTPTSMEIRFEPEILDSPAGLIAFDPKNRKKVEQVHQLVHTRMEPGMKAPALGLSRLGGGVLTLSQLRDRVVVLDFFSSTCEACNEHLAETERLASWASEEGLEIVFLAVHTQEDVTSDRQARAVAAEYLDTHQLSLPALLDWNHELLITLGAPGVPSLYLIAPSGGIASFYDGAARPSFVVLQRELLELAGAPTP